MITNDGVDNAQHFALFSARAEIAVANGGDDRQAEEKGAREGPLLLALAVVALVAVLDCLQQLSLEALNLLGG